MEGKKRETCASVAGCMFGLRMFRMYRTSAPL